jgi:hypothetical protein
VYGKYGNSVQNLVSLSSNLEGLVDFHNDDTHCFVSFHFTPQTRINHCNIIANTTGHKYSGNNQAYFEWNIAFTPSPSLEERDVFYNSIFNDLSFS